MVVIPAFADAQAEVLPISGPSEQLRTAKSRLAIAEGSKVDGILSAELVPAFEGTVTVQEALTKAAGQIDQLLAAD
jgi:multiple sugar transport system substrate-binding protein